MASKSISLFFTLKNNVSCINGYIFEMVLKFQSHLLHFVVKLVILSFIENNAITVKLQYFS